MCEAPEIPHRLHSNNRPVDNSFTGSDLIYRRFREVVSPSEWEAKQIPSNIFPLNDDSYNWNRYSEKPTDVLYNIAAKEVNQHFFNYGIVEVSCEIVLGKFFPEEPSKGEGQGYVVLSHAPENCMYPHIEMLLYDVKTECKAESKPRNVKAALRRVLLNTSSLVKVFVSDASSAPNVEGSD